MMSRWWRRLVNLLAIVILAASAVTVLPGCEKQSPLGDAGEEVEEMGEEVGEAVEEAGDVVDK